MQYVRRLSLIEPFKFVFFKEFLFFHFPHLSPMSVLLRSFSAMLADIVAGS